MPAAEHRAGIIALLGEPNAGKSTLFNKLLNAELAVVTRKAQTTRSRILGVLTRPEAQALLLDTPGVQPAAENTRAHTLNRALNEAGARAAAACDAALLLVDPLRGWNETHVQLHKRLLRREAKVIIAATKQDCARRRAKPLPAELNALPVSSKNGQGVESLLKRAIAALPLGRPLYAADTLTDRPLRFLAAEQIRKALFEQLQQELPYGAAVEIITYKEDAALVRIRANVLVARKSQKGMVIGKGGAALRAIGIQARAGLEALLQQQVHLELRVKLEPKWNRNPARLKELGYN